MKKLTAFILAGLLFGNTAFADTCGTALTNVFTAAQAVKLCKSFGSAVNSSFVPAADNTNDIGSSSSGWRSGYFDTSVLSPLIIPPGDLTIRVDADAQRLYTVGASSDTAFTFTFGDGGTTAAQTLTLSASTADSDDDSAVLIAGGGAATTGRGGYAAFYGQEHATKGGAIELVSTGGADGRIIIDASSGGAISLRNGGTVQWLSDATSFRGDATNGVPIVFNKAGTNVQLAPYVPTMAATPVVGTNMIQPGLNVIPTAAANTAAIIGPSTPVAGQQFDITNSGPNSVRIKAGGGATMNGVTAGGYLVLATLNKARCVTQSATNYDCELEVLPTPAGP